VSDRFHSLTVVLEQDIRDDDAESLMDGIRMMRGVLWVTGEVACPVSCMAEERARADLGKKLLAIVYPKLGNS
jgi:hypothetical protein